MKYGRNVKGYGALRASGIKRIAFMIVFVIIQTALVFAAAGSFNVPRVWLYLLLFVGYLGVSTLIAVLFFPDMIELVNHRGEKKDGTKQWDKIIASLYSLLAFIIPFTAGLDVGRYHWSSMGFEILVLGMILYLLAFSFGQWAMLVNRHFETTVRIQNDRDHHVVTKGPYRLIRHPGYVSAIMMNISFPLIMGSVFTFLPVSAAVLLMIIRTYLEDRTLQKELPGYSAYASKVKYKLFPGIW